VDLAFPTFNSSLLTFNSPGIYALTLSESDTTPITQCFGKTDFPVRIWPQPTANQILGTDSLCVDGNEELKIKNEESESQYSWNASLGTIEYQQPNGGKVNYRAEFESPADFTSVRITSLETSEKGCLGPENEKTLIVESAPIPKIGVPARSLEWKALQNQAYEVIGRHGSYFEWQAENGDVTGGQGTPSVSVNWQIDRHTYRLKVRELTHIGCIGETDYQVIPYDSALFVPNLITPNGDSKNDVFRIENLHFYPAMRLEIYDRWGKRVFESDRYQNNWPTEPISAGVYFYYLQATGSKATKGNLLVVE